jgi:cell division septum initiation protein DivIVA
MANNQATIEDLLDELYDIIENAKTLPFFSGKCMVDGEEIRQILDDLRDVIPDEIRKARSIVDDRARIIDDAHAEADAAIKAAERKADSLVNEQEIVRRAAARANEIDKAGQEKYRNSVNATYDYVENLLKAADDAFAEQLGDIRRMRQDIKDNRRKELKNI